MASPRPAAPADLGQDPVSEQTPASPATSLPHPRPVYSSCAFLIPPLLRSMCSLTAHCHCDPRRKTWGHPVGIPPVRLPLEAPAYLRTPPRGARGSSP